MEEGLEEKNGYYNLKAEIPEKSILLFNKKG